jgi:hypothetical protein
MSINIKYNSKTDRQGRSITTSSRIFKTKPLKSNTDTTKDAIDSSELSHTESY